MLTQRLEKFIHYLGLTVHAFEVNIGVSNTTLRKAIDNDKGIGSKILEKIFATYPQLSFEWLITGRGEMIMGEIKKNSTQDELAPLNGPFKSFPKIRENKIVPILDAKAAAGDPFIFDHPDYFRKLDSFTFPVSMFQPGNYASIQVRGDSMAETLHAGDFVIGREIENLTQLKAGDIYIIIYQEDSRPHFLVKRCFYYIGDDVITLQSDNPLDKSRDSSLPVTTLLKLYHVVGRFTTTIGRSNGNVVTMIERIDTRLRNIEERLD